MVDGVFDLTPGEIMQEFVGGIFSFAVLQLFDLRQLAVWDQVLRETS